MDLNEFRLRAERGETGIDPKLQTAARSGNKYAQRELDRQLGAQDRQAEQNANDAQREAEKAQREAAANAEKAQREAAQEAERIRARDVRAGAAQGQKTVTDIETGKRSIATHADGAPVYKPGAVPGTLGLTAIEQAGPTPNGKPNVAAAVTEQYRNDRGETITAPVEQKTDPATGQTYIERPDAYGRPQKIVTGTDPAAQRKVQLERQRDEVALHRQNLEIARNQLAPQWEPIEKAYYTAKAIRDKAPPFQQTARGYVETKTGMPADPAKVSEWQRKAKTDEGTYLALKKQFEERKPQWDSLVKQEQDAKTIHLNLEAERMRLELGLPESDGGIARSIAAQQAGEDPHAQAKTDIGLDPTADPTAARQEIDAANEAPPPPEAPRIPVPTDAAKEALSSLQGVENLTITPQKHTALVERDGKWIGTVEPDSSGATILTLRDDARTQQDIQNLIATGGTGPNALPLYARDNPERRPHAETVQWAAGVFQAMGAPEGTAPMTAEQRWAQLQETGATPQDITRKVANGLLDVQTGSALLKELYGQNLTPDKFNAPADFQQWLERTTKQEIKDGVKPDQTTAAKWSTATTRSSKLAAAASIPTAGFAAILTSTYSLSEQNQIKQDYARDYVRRNANKPGMNRAAQKALYQQDAADSASIGDRLNSWATAVGNIGKYDAGGAMLGMGAGLVRDASLGEAALFGNDFASEKFWENVQLRNRDFANFADSTKRNLKAWLTPQGQELAGNLENATAELQRVMDRNADALTPNQAEYDAALIKVKDATLALHGLAPDPDWPLTMGDLDPDKDAALGMALANYQATADPRAFQLFKDRLLMSNGRRQFSAEMEKRTKGMGKFAQSFTNGMNVGWQELAVEMLADASFALTGGLAAPAKGAQIAARTGSAAAKAGRISRAASSILEGVAKWERLGLKTGTLANPLTKGQKATNLVVKTGKTGLQGAIGEGTEEVITEFGSDRPDFAHAFLGGAVGGVIMIPLFGGIQKGASMVADYRATAQEEASLREFAQRYNAAYADVPGFQPIDHQTAAAARQFINPEARQAALAAIDESLKSIEITEQEQAAAEKVMPEQRQQSLEENAAYIEKALQDRPNHPKRAQMEADLGRIRDRIALSDQGKLTNQKIQARQQIEQVAGQIAAEDAAAIEAVSGLQALTPEERTASSAMGKAATGNTAALSPQERKAIEGRRTAEGQPYFGPLTQEDGSPMLQEDGTPVEGITPEGISDLQATNPGIARLIRPTASYAQYARGAAATTPTTSKDAAAADTPVTDGPNYARVPVSPEQTQQATEVAAEVTRQIQKQYPQIAARLTTGDATINRVTGGVDSITDESGNHVVRIIQEDLAQALTTGMSPQELIKRTIDNIVLHETLHTLQFQIAEVAGKPAKEFYGNLYAQMAAESPQMLAAGRELYGEVNWDTLQEWQRSAEVVRMLAEAKIAGRTTDVHRLLADASPGILARLAAAVRSLIDAITTGKDVPAPVKAHVEELTALYNELINAPTPANASPTNPGNRSQKPTASQAGARDSAAPEAGSDRQSADDGQTQPPPGDPASPPAAAIPEVSDSLAAARKLTTAEFKKALEQKPILKKDPALVDALNDVAFQLAESIQDLTPAQQKEAVSRAINGWLLSPEIADRVSELYAEEKAKAKAYRLEADRRVRAEADRIIVQKMEAVNHLVSNVGRINRPPNALAMIARGETLPTEYEAAPRVSAYPGGGKNAVIRAIINRIWADSETSGISPDTAAKGMEMPDGKYARLTGDELWQAIQKELRGYANGAETAADIYDPDAELTDEQIEAAIAKLEQDNIADKWREITGRASLSRGDAGRMEAEYRRIVDEELGGVEPDDFTADDIHTRVVDAMRPQAAPQGKTPAQKAPINPRVDELSKPQQDDMLATEAPLDITALEKIQNHLPALTRVTGTPTVTAALQLAARIIPYFQGNKLKMTGPVVSAAEQYWSPAQRDAITTLHDLFGGGGAWGITIAESLFPNLRHLHINEFDSTRATKIRAQIEYGDQFAEIAASPEVRYALGSIIAAHRMRPSVQRKIAAERAKAAQQNFIGEQQLSDEEVAEMNEAWSWGVINKTAAEFAKTLDPATQDKVAAILKTMADDPERSGPWFKDHPDTEPTIDELVSWFQARHAPKAASIHQAAKRMADRGVQFHFTNADAYEMDIEQGAHVMVLADPPYFATTGYAENNQKTVVGPDIYARSASLMADLASNDNNVIYTDEAWWLRDKIDNAVRPADLVTGQKLAEDIGNTLDFTVVAEQIDSRYETLGLHNPAGSPVAASRSASRQRDLHRSDEGQGDGSGDRRGGGTSPVAVPTGADGQAGLQPADAGPADSTVDDDLPEDNWLGSAPSQPRIRRSIDELESLAQSQESFRFWFQEFKGFLVDFLGPNKEYAPLVSEFLNATSAASTVGSNVQAMMKALREYIETGTFVSNFLPAHRGNLDKAQSGQTLSGPKISEYSDAVFGIETAVPVDRHIAQLLFNTDKPTKAQIAAARIRVAKVGLRLGWTPRQTMATLWAANIDRNGRTPQSYERYLQKHRYEIKRLLTADREGNQRGLKASRRIASRIEQRRSAEGSTDGRAAGAVTLGSAPIDRKPSESGEDYYARITKQPVVRFEKSRIVHHTTGHKSAEAITADEFKTGKETGLYEKRSGVYFADEDVNPGIYARNGEGETNEGQETRTLPIDIKGLNLLNNEYAPEQGYPNHKQYGNNRIRGEFDVLPEGVDGYISFMSDGRIYEVALPAKVANKARADNKLFSPAAQPSIAERMESDFGPLTPKNVFDSWQASTTEPDILTGYRGENGNGKADNGYGGSEGIGLYIAKDKQDTAFFGKSRPVNFPKPKRPLIVDQDGKGESIPMLEEGNEELWDHIWSHKPDPQDSDWIKAHVLAAKKLGMTQENSEGWDTEIPRALTDILLAMGYDAVYVRGGGMQWVNILAKPNQRFNRGTRSAGGTALYSPAPIIPEGKYETKGTTTRFDVATNDDFKIQTGSGASVSGYLRNIDFPGDRESPTRGEVFLTNVPEGQRGKGLGYSLTKDAVTLIRENGCTHVNMSPVSEGGKAIVAKLQKEGIISAPLRTSQSGKSEHKILTASVGQRSASLPRVEPGSTGVQFPPNPREEKQTTSENGQMSLFSPASDNQAALEAALAGMPPIARDVFRASMANPSLTPDALASQFGIRSVAVQHMLADARARIRTNTEAVSPGGISPTRTADGKLNGGRPDLAYSTDETLARVDQIRNQEELPQNESLDALRAQGEAYLRQPNAIRTLIDAQRAKGLLNPIQTAAANIAILEASTKGKVDLETVELAYAYRESGSAWSQAGLARRDVHHSPAERHAMIFGESFTTPDKATREAIKKATTKEGKEAIMQGWVNKAKGLKEALLARGVDIDAALARVNQQIADTKEATSEASQRHQMLVDALQQEVDDLKTSLTQAQSRAQSAATAAQKAQAEAEAAKASQKLEQAQQNAQEAKALDPANTLKLEMRKLSDQHRLAMEAMIGGATWDQTAVTTGMNTADIRQVALKFQRSIAAAAAKAGRLAHDIMLGRETALSSPASLASANSIDSNFEKLGNAVAAALGVDIAAWDRRSKPATATTAKKGSATKKEAAPDPAMMSDEEFARRQNTPDMHRALWQFEMATLRPQNRITFEAWQAKPEVKKLAARQERMWKQPVSTTTGTLDMHDPISVKRTYDMFHSLRASWGDKLLDYWRMSILTGPQTAIVNTASNVAHSAYHLGPRRVLEASVNHILSAVGLGSKDAATFGEMKVIARVAEEALKKAGANMLQSWAIDGRVFESQVIALGQMVDFSGMKFDYMPRAIGGKFGTLMHSLSFRHMTAADEFIKTLHGHMAAAAHAHRIAKTEGLSDAAYEARMTELMKFGSEAWSRAVTEAENITFQDEIDVKSKRAIAVLDKMAAGLRRLSTTETDTKRTVIRNGKPVQIAVRKGNALALIFPFINTPLNIFKSAIEMSPVGALLAVVDGARALKIKLAKGTMTKEQADIAASELYDRARLVKDVTNQLIAAGVFWAMGSLVAPGDDEDDLPFITGTVDWKNTRKGARDVMYRTMPPMSIRIGKDKFFSYSRIEPFATALAAMVDLRLSIAKNGGINDKSLGEFVAGMQNQLDNKTFMSGLSDLINAYHDPERFASKLTGNIVTGFVPNLIRQPIREVDPYIRDTKVKSGDGFFTAIGKQVGYSLAPGYATPLMDIWGNPVTRNQGQNLGSPQTDVLIRVFDPTNLTIGSKIDPIDRYIFNWNNQVADPKEQLALEPIRNYIDVTINGERQRFDLSPEEYKQANENAGRAARQFLGDQWDSRQPTPEGIDRIKQVVQHFQKIERDRLRREKATSL